MQMSKPQQFRECLLTQDGHRATAWIRADLAVIGNSVTIPEVSGRWTIFDVGRTKDGLQLRAIAADQPPLPRPRIELAKPRDPFPGFEPPAPDPIVPHRSHWVPA
jgi:hypothetical protein